MAVTPKVTRVIVLVFCTLSHSALHLCNISWKIYQMVFNLQSGHEYKVDMATFNIQRTITLKVGKLELLFMCSACRLIVLYICVKFQENTTNWISVMERTWVHGRNGCVKCSRGNNSKSRQTKLSIIRSAHHLMVLYIGVKFHENISKGIRVMGWTRSYEVLMDRKTPKILDGTT